MNRIIKTKVALAILILFTAIIGFVLWQAITGGPIRIVQMDAGHFGTIVASTQSIGMGQTQVQSEQSGQANLSPNTPAPPQTIDLRDHPLVSPDSPVAIHFTLKDGKGKLLQGVECDVTTDNAKRTKMVTVAYKKSNANGECNFENLDNKDPYLVRIVWSKDPALYASVSLSWIKPGTTETRIIIRPDKPYF